MLRVLNKESITEDNPFYGLTQYQPATIWDAFLILDMDRLKTWQDVESKIKSVITDSELEQISHRKRIWPTGIVKDTELEAIYVAFLSCYCRGYEMQREDFLEFLYEELQSFELGFVEY